MRQSVLFVCKTCNFTGTPEEKNGIRSGYRLLEKARHELATREGGDKVELRAMSCFGQCSRSCVASVSGDAKMTYMVGDLNPDTAVSDLVDFALHHANTEDGQVAWKLRADCIKKGSIARIPSAGYTDDPVEQEWDALA